MADASAGVAHVACVRRQAAVVDVDGDAPGSDAQPILAASLLSLPREPGVDRFPSFSWFPVRFFGDGRATRSREEVAVILRERSDRRISRVTVSSSRVGSFGLRPQDDSGVLFDPRTRCQGSGALRSGSGTGGWEARLGALGWWPVRAGCLARVAGAPAGRSRRCGSPCQGSGRARSGVRPVGLAGWQAAPGIGLVRAGGLARRAGWAGSRCRGAGTLQPGVRRARLRRWPPAPGA
jgi:hypothetical protein